MRKGAGRRCRLPLRSRTLAHLEPSLPTTMWYAPGTGALGQSSVWRDKTPRRERRRRGGCPTPALAQTPSHFSSADAGAQPSCAYASATAGAQPACQCCRGRQRQVEGTPLLGAQPNPMYFPDQEWSTTSNLFELSTGLRPSSACLTAAAPPSPGCPFVRRVCMRLLSLMGSTPAVTGATSGASVISLLQLPIEAAACLSSCCSCRLRPLSASAVRFLCLLPLFRPWIRPLCRIRLFFARLRTSRFFSPSFSCCARSLWLLAGASPVSPCSLFPP